LPSWKNCWRNRELFDDIFTWRDEAPKQWKAVTLQQIKTIPAGEENAKLVIPGCCPLKLVKALIVGRDTGMGWMPPIVMFGEATAKMHP
jgi:hypothetical protein